MCCLYPELRRAEMEAKVRSRYKEQTLGYLPRLKLFFSNPLTGYFPVSCSAPRGSQASVGLYSRTSPRTAVSLGPVFGQPNPFPHVLLLCMSRTRGHCSLQGGRCVEMRPPLLTHPECGEDVGGVGGRWDEEQVHPTGSRSWTLTCSLWNPREFPCPPPRPHM